jgi:hypothetical protein
MNIYLDINGVIEYNDKITEGFKEFLLKVIDKHEVYFLTTHCQGDTIPTLKYLVTITDDQVLLNTLAKIRPTEWEFFKPQGIDYDSDFVWYDDKPLSDIEIEHMGPAVKNFRLVDLNMSPDFWKEEISNY